jgi:hypothetical protein
MLSNTSPPKFVQPFVALMKVALTEFLKSMLGCLDAYKGHPNNHKNDKVTCFTSQPIKII